MTSKIPVASYVGMGGRDVERVYDLGLALVDLSL